MKSGGSGETRNKVGWILDDVQAVSRGTAAIERHWQWRMIRRLTAEK
jgi:hypothetical protein